VSSTTVSLGALLPESNRVPELRAMTQERVVTELLETLASLHGLDAGAVDAARESILAREREATTGIGNGVAIPHMKSCPHVTSVCAVMGKASCGIDWNATDGGPARLFFMILTPEGQESEHVRVMRRIVQLSRDRKTVDHLVESAGFGNLDAIFEEVDAASD